MTTPPIRTITFGIDEAHPLTSAAIERAAFTLREASTRYEAAGYEIQTVRLSTRPIFDDLADWPPVELLNYARELQHMLDDYGLSYCSIGTAMAARPDFPLEKIHVIADLLAATSALNATVQLATVRYGLRAAAALPTAEVIKRLAAETQEGFGNFRFAMLSCVEAGGPFFPSAYHSGPASLSLGLQGAGIIAEVVANITGAASDAREVRIGEGWNTG